MRWRKALIVCITVGWIVLPQDTARTQTTKEGDQPLRFYTMRAVNLGDAGKYQDEIDTCNEGLAVFPGNPDLRELIAEGLSGLGRYKEAEDLFLNLINSNDPKDQADLIWVLAGYEDMLIKQKRMDEAMQIRQRLIDGGKRNLAENQGKK